MSGAIDTEKLIRDVVEATIFFSGGKYSEEEILKTTEGYIRSLDLNVLTVNNITTNGLAKNVLEIINSRQ